MQGLLPCWQHLGVPRIVPTFSSRSRHSQYTFKHKARSAFPSTHFLLVETTSKAGLRRLPLSKDWARNSHTHCDTEISCTDPHGTESKIGMRWSGVIDNWVERLRRTEHDHCRLSGSLRCRERSRYWTSKNLCVVGGIYIHKSKT